MYGKSMDISVLNGKKVDHEKQSVKEKVSIAMSNCNRVMMSHGWRFPEDNEDPKMDTQMRHV